MTSSEFLLYIEKYRPTIDAIRESAHQIHASVNQTYDGHPYALHLDMVADVVRQYGHAVCAVEADVVPLLFGAYFHDSIEDARLTYGDVTRTARRWMTDEQALTAAEIVYALTNDKGRTRAERAGEKYYQGIRETPYAPFVKLADRVANITYSCTDGNECNSRMKEVYRQEMPHFLAAIDAHSEDPRLGVPNALVESLIIDN